MHVENMTILQETVLTLEKKETYRAIAAHVKYGRARSQKLFYTQFR